MRLKLQLPAKAGQFRISECEAAQLFTLSASDFQAFLNWPQKEKCRDIQPPYYGEEGKRIYRGVLILGEGLEDGIFAYDAGEHFAYLPGARAVVDSVLEQAVEKPFDLRPAAIIRDLDLRRPIYRQPAAYGHFGRTDIDLPWERTDRVEQLKAKL